jgi:hypothetical protein
MTWIVLIIHYIQLLLRNCETKKVTEEGQMERKLERRRERAIKYMGDGLMSRKPFQEGTIGPPKLQFIVKTLSIERVKANTRKGSQGLRKNRDSRLLM